jgi:hypothetical protein
MYEWKAMSPDFANVESMNFINVKDIVRNAKEKEGKRQTGKISENIGV